MKEAMLYALIAIMLGALTMVAPLMAVKLGNYRVSTSTGEKNTSALLEALDEGKETYEEREAPERVVISSNLSSVGLMLISSSFFASDISLCFKKRYRIKNGCAHSNRGVVVADGR
jgi:hypothetical protein